MPEPHRTRRVAAALGLAVLIALAWAGVVVVQRQRQVAELSEVFQRESSLGAALSEFAAEYGRYPDATTAKRVKADTNTPLTLGDQSSNRLFRQLLAWGLKSEKPFFAKIHGSHKPDDLFQDDAHALAPGECGFAYVAGLKQSSGDGEAPILLSPMIPGTMTFDPAPFGRRAAILYSNNAVGWLPIGEDGHVLINGVDLFDPRQPFWDGKAPDLKWQESP